MKGDFLVYLHTGMLVISELGYGDGSECSMCEYMDESLYLCKRSCKFAFEMLNLNLGNNETKNSCYIYRYRLPTGSDGLPKLFQYSETDVGNGGTCICGGGTSGFGDV